MAIMTCRCGSVRIDFPTNAELFRRECCCHNCIVARWREGMKLKGCGWVARGARLVWTPSQETSVTRHKRAQCHTSRRGTPPGKPYGSVSISPRLISASPQERCSYRMVGYFRQVSSTWTRLLADARIESLELFSSLGFGWAHQPGPDHARETLMRIGTCTVIMIGILIAGTGPASAVVDPAVRCEAQKVKAAGDYADCQLMAEQKAIMQGKPVDFSKCIATFLKKWQQIEDKDGSACPTLGDVMAVQDFVLECTDTLATALSGAGFPPPVCAAFPATGQTAQVVQNDDGAIEAGATLSYTDNGNGAITDNNTGLMWEKKISRDNVVDAANLNDADNTYPWRGSCSISGAECGTDTDCPNGETCDAGDGQTPPPNGRTIFEWVAALNAANFGGYNDWRIPNIKEQQSIVNYGAHQPALDPAFHGGSCGAACTDLTDPACSCTKSANYWSATTYDDNPDRAWTVNYFDGFGSFFTKTLPLSVRAVRDGS